MTDSFIQSSGVRCQVRCQVSHVMFQMSHVMCQMLHVFFFKFQTDWRSLLVDSLLSSGPTPSSLQATMVLNAIIEINIYKKKKANKNHVTITVLSL